MPDPSNSPSPHVYTYDDGSGTNYGSREGDLSDLFTTTGGTNNASNYQTKTCKLVIKYDLNGGPGNPPPNYVKTYSGVRKAVTFTATVSEYPGSEEPTPITKTVNGSTYYFLGWSESSSATVSQYDPGHVIKKTWSKNESGTKTYKLYAVWVNKNVFIYMPDEYSNEKKYKYGVKETGNNTLRGALFTRKGYTQIKWDDRQGNTPDVGGSYYSSSSGAVVLYPVWEANTYHITYKNNGGTGNEVTDTVTYDSTAVIRPIDLFEKTGYYIEHWNEAEDGTSSSWYPGKEYTFQRDEDIVLYAYWSGRKYYVLYDNEEIGEIENLSVAGTINTNLELNANDCLYSEGNDLHKNNDDILYISYPAKMLYVIDERFSSDFSIATYGSPFYTDIRPVQKYGYSFAGWESDDGTTLTKQNVWMDAYSFGSDPIWTRQENVILKSIWSNNYPYGKIFFGQKESLDCGIIIEKPPNYYWPEFSYIHNKANGRNGDILANPERYENVKKVYSIAVYNNDGFYEAASKLSDFLHGYYGKGYVRLEDSYEPDVYMLAVYEESGNLENLLSQAGRTDIAFNCKPQKFLRSGDRKIDILNSNTYIINPTNNPSCPIINIKGSGVVNISGVEIEIVENFNNIILDCESCNAVDNLGRNMNYFIGFLEPIRLYPGENLITYDGYIEHISIIPRWWKI